MSDCHTVDRGPLIEEAVTQKTHLTDEILPELFDETGQLIDNRIHREVMRELWVLDGIIEHGLRYEVLQQVNKNFEKIDSVPQGY